MLYRQVTDLLENNKNTTINHHWVDSNKISKHAFAAVIAAEDQLFYQHWGYDTASIILAIKTRQAGDRLRGASTITQQLAKTFSWCPLEVIGAKVL